MKNRSGFIDVSLVAIGALIIGLSSLLTLMADSTITPQKKATAKILTVSTSPSCPADTKSERTYGECCGCGKAKEVRECTMNDGSKQYHSSDCVHDSAGCTNNCPAQQPSTPTQSTQPAPTANTIVKTGPAGGCGKQVFFYYNDGTYAGNTCSDASGNYRFEFKTSDGFNWSAHGGDIKNPGPGDIKDNVNCQSQSKCPGTSGNCAAQGKCEGASGCIDPSNACYAGPGPNYCGFKCQSGAWVTDSTCSQSQGKPACGGTAVTNSGSSSTSNIPGTGGTNPTTNTTTTTGCYSAPREACTAIDPTYQWSNGQCCPRTTTSTNQTTLKCGNGILDSGEICDKIKSDIIGNEVKPSCIISGSKDCVWRCNANGITEECNSECTGYINRKLCTADCGGSSQCNYINVGQPCGGDGNNKTCNDQCQCVSTNINITTNTTTTTGCYSAPREACMGIDPTNQWSNGSCCPKTINPPASNSTVSNFCSTKTGYYTFNGSCYYCNNSTQAQQFDSRYCEENQSICSLTSSSKDPFYVSRTSDNKCFYCYRYKNGESYGYHILPNDKNYGNCPKNTSSNDSLCSGCMRADEWKNIHDNTEKSNYSLSSQCANLYCPKTTQSSTSTSNSMPAATGCNNPNGLSGSKTCIDNNVYSCGLRYGINVWNMSENCGNRGCANNKCNPIPSCLNDNWCKNQCSSNETSLGQLDCGKYYTNKSSGATASRSCCQPSSTTSTTKSIDQTVPACLSSLSNCGSGRLNCISGYSCSESCPDNQEKCKVSNDILCCDIKITPTPTLKPTATPIPVKEICSPKDWCKNYCSGTESDLGKRDCPVTGRILFIFGGTQQTCCQPQNVEPAEKSLPTSTPTPTNTPIPTATPTLKSIPVELTCSRLHTGGQCRFDCYDGKRFLGLIDQGDLAFNDAQDCKGFDTCCVKKANIPTTANTDNLCEQKIPNGKCIPESQCDTKSGKDIGTDAADDCMLKTNEPGNIVKFTCCAPKADFPRERLCSVRHGGTCTDNTSNACTPKQHYVFNEKDSDCALDGKICCAPKPEPTATPTPEPTATPTSIPENQTCSGRYPGASCESICVKSGYKWITDSEVKDCGRRSCCGPIPKPTATPTIPNELLCSTKYPGGHCTRNSSFYCHPKDNNVINDPDNDCAKNGEICCVPKIKPTATPIPVDQTCSGRYQGYSCQGNCIGKSVVKDPLIKDCQKLQLCCGPRQIPTLTPTATPTPLPTKPPEYFCSNIHPNNQCLKKSDCNPSTSIYNDAKDCQNNSTYCCQPKPVGTISQPAATAAFEGQIMFDGTDTPTMLNFLQISQVLAAEKKVIPFAQVIITGSNGKTYQTTADQFGKFKIDLPIGITYTVKIVASGYKTVENKVNITDSTKKYTADINLVSAKNTKTNGTIKVQETVKPKIITLTSGWNLISLPVNPTKSYTALSILVEINNQGGKASMIARLQNGSWQVYILDKVGEDFPIEVGKAYFVFNQNDVEVTVAGQDVANISYQLSNGWNSVGFPKKIIPNQTADMTLRLINQEQCTVISGNQCANNISVSQYLDSLWQSRIKNNNQDYGDNFNIEDGNGYLLKVESPISLTP